MGPQLAIFCITLFVGPHAAHRPAEVSWTAGVSLWTSLSPAGQVVDAGPFADWNSTPAAARIGALLEQPRSAPEPLPRPRELPQVLHDASGPSLPILMREPPSVPFAAPLNISTPTTSTFVPRPEMASPPVATQATQRRTIRSASSKIDDAPAARLALPKP